MTAAHVSAAGMRLGGAALTALGLLVGLRTLGPSQFGHSILPLAAGTLLSLPAISLERLVLRLAATGASGDAAHVLRLGRAYGLAVGALSAAIAGLALLLDVHLPVPAITILATGATTVSMTEVVLRQSFARARGRIWWGQFPNEVFRPTATIVAYLVAHLLPHSVQGGSATLGASAACWLFMFLAPRDHETSGAPRRTRLAHLRRLPRPTLHAMPFLIIVSLVAALIERGYPLLLGHLSTSEVAAYTVGSRIIQTGSFGQALAIFVLSPRLARSLEGRQELQASTQSSARWVRLLGIGGALPLALVCLAAPGLVSAVLGHSLALDDLLRASAVGLLAVMIAGPSQTVLLMAGREKIVSIAYGVGYLAGLTVFVATPDKTASAAMWATTLSYVTWSSLMSISCRRRFGVWV